MKLVDFWHLIRESWKDPRKKAIIKLSFYIIFFTIVIFMIKINQPVLDNVEETKVNDNYRFTCEVNNNVIVGNYDNNIIRYELDKQIYYIYDDITYKLVNDILVEDKTQRFKIDKFLLNKIEYYISSAEELYKTEFKDGRIKKGYQMLSENFAFLYDNKEITDKEYIPFNITSMNDQIIEIEFDLTNYFKNYYKLKISFSDFNTSDKLKLNFSK